MKFYYRFLRSAVYGINTSWQRTTKHTPFFLMYLRNPKGPYSINDLHKAKEGVECDVFSFDDTASQLMIEKTCEMRVAVENDVSMHIMNCCIMQYCILYYKTVEPRFTNLIGSVTSFANQNVHEPKSL